MDLVNWEKTAKFCAQIENVEGRAEDTGKEEKGVYMYAFLSLFDFMIFGLDLPRAAHHTGYVSGMNADSLGLLGGRARA